MNKCKGCGSTLQYEDPNKKGYAVNQSMICKRCFDLTHYNKNTIFDSQIDNDKLLLNINKKNIFTLFLCDILSFNEKTLSIYKNITNDKIFVLTKVDAFAKNIKYEKVINNIKNNYNIDVIIYSYKNSFLKNNLLSLLNKHKKVLITGITSSGKSTLINTLFDKNITVSLYKNTTLDFIEINHENLTIIDSPGFDTKNILTPLKNSLKEKIINLKPNYEVKINNICFYTKKSINMCVFMPNMDIKTYKNKDEYKLVNILDNTDLVFENFFIYFKKGGCIYLNIDNYDLRKSIVGSYEQN